jgi:hypothetical protein
MPRYTFTGDSPAILVGLIQNVNADHVAAPDNPEVPEGTTIVAHPGDVVDTRDLEYPAASLVEEARKPAKARPAPDSTPSDPTL